MIAGEPLRAAPDETAAAFTKRLIVAIEDLAGDPSECPVEAPADATRVSEPGSLVTERVG